MWKLIVVVCFFGEAIASCAFCRNKINIIKIPTQKISAPVIPYWDIPTQSLYWVNFKSDGSEPAIFRYSYDENAVYSAYLSGVNSVSFIVANRDGTFTVGVGNDVLIIQWDGKFSNATFISNLFSLDANVPMTMISEGCVSPAGRFFGGVLSKDYCKRTDFSPYSVYKYDKPNGLVKVISGTYTLGIVFDPVKNIMYHLGACLFYITAYDWNPNTGDICNPRVVVDFDAIGYQTYLNSPRSLGIDNKGNLYTSTQNGTVLIMDPMQGTIIKTITMPVRGSSSVIYGGPNLDILYVLCAGQVVDLSTGKPGYNITDGSSLYAITGLGRTFDQTPARLNVF